MGTPEFAVTSLNALVSEKMNIVGVVTTPDKQAGRGRSIQQSDIKKYALKQNLLLFQPVNLKDSLFIEEMKSIKPDLFVVVAFRMLPEVLWKMPKYGTINLHASLLPNYRGAAPINWSIINGETETGVTTFFINKEIDKGKIIFQEKVKIEENYSAGELHDILMNLGSKLLIKTIYGIFNNQYSPIDQEKIISRTTILKNAPKIIKEDCKINWNDKNINVYNFVRGLSPYPGAYSELISPNQLKFLIKIYKTALVNEPSNKEIGSIFTDQKTFVNVATTDGMISLQEVQLTGRKKLRIDEFLRGFPINNTWKF